MSIFNTEKPKNKNKGSLIYFPNGRKDWKEETISSPAVSAVSACS